MKVQHWLDDDEDVPENEYDGITCPIRISSTVGQADQRLTSFFSVAFKSAWSFQGPIDRRHSDNDHARTPDERTSPRVIFCARFTWADRLPRGFDLQRWLNGGCLRFDNFANRAACFGLVGYNRAIWTRAYRLYARQPELHEEYFEPLATVWTYVGDTHRSLQTPRTRWLLNNVRGTRFLNLWSDKTAHRRRRFTPGGPERWPHFHRRGCTKSGSPA